MLIYAQKLDTVSDLSYVVDQLNRAIGTKYIPTGDSVEEIISSFSKIQLSRQFTGCGASASLALFFTDQRLKVAYSSTSGTAVEFEIELNDNMEFPRCRIQVDIPEDRAVPGRTHYEAITKALYPGGFFRWVESPSRGRKFLAVKPGRDRPIPYLPTPVWVLDDISDRAENKTEVFSRYGFKPVTLRGFCAAWERQDGCIIVQIRDEGDGSPFAFLQGTRPPQYGRSYRGILVDLKERERLATVGAGFIAVADSARVLADTLLNSFRALRNWTTENE